MSYRIQVSFEVDVDSPATITAYGIALGYALRSAAANAVAVADQPDAEVRQYEVSLTLAEVMGGKRG